MKSVRKIKKRYFITISAIIIAVLSVLLLRTLDINYEQNKVMTEKEIKAIVEYNQNFLVKTENNHDTKAFRDNFANKISYKKLFNQKSDFRNFKDLPNKDIYGLQLLNNSHVAFYHNSSDCGEYNKNKDYCVGIMVDTNGYTRPNKLGKDQYILKIYKDIISE